MAASTPTPNPATHKPRPVAKLSNAPVIGRSRLLAQFQRKATKLATTTDFPTAAAFLPWHWAWIVNYLKSVFHRKYKPFPVYPAGASGVYPLRAIDGDNVVKIAIAGDWGTGTVEAQEVANSMMKWNPDYTLHLGDVYYVGDTPEIDENCLGHDAHGYKGVKWPSGTQGTFALNGNHEMYCGGHAYFKYFLSKLGPGNPPQGQPTSFFCLETPCWRILAIDTSYNSVGLPILGALPWIDQLSFVGANSRLEDGQIAWLRGLNLRENIKPTLVLSHHQYYSAFPEQVYTLPAQQLAEFFPNQEIVWMWGHEHRMAIYDKFSKEAGGNLCAYGRCLGHGGMPVSVSKPDGEGCFDASKAPLTFYDTSTHNLSDGTPVGRNGFVLMTLDGFTLTFDYRDARNLPMFVEKFVGSTDGRIAYSHDPPPAGGLTAVDK
jgi:hypothetical protein